MARETSVVFKSKSSRDKVSKDLQYPLTASQVETLWLPFNSKVELNLNFQIGQNPKSEPFYVFRAHYLLPNENVRHDRVAVYIHAVPTEAMNAICPVLDRDLLPSFKSWLERLVRLPENSSVFTGGSLTMSAQYSSGKLSIQYEE